MVACQLRAAGLDPDLEALSLLAMSAGLGTSILGGQSSPGQAQAVIDTTYRRLVTVSGRIYVTDFGSAEVTVLDGSRCNASVTSGCGAPVREQAVGSQPVGLAVSPQTSTVYVIDTFQAGSMSILTS